MFFLSGRFIVEERAYFIIHTADGDRFLRFSEDFPIWIGSKSRGGVGGRISVWTQSDEAESCSTRCSRGQRSSERLRLFTDHHGSISRSFAEPRGMSSEASAPHQDFISQRLLYQSHKCFVHGVTSTRGHICWLGVILKGFKWCDYLMCAPSIRPVYQVLAFLHSNLW